jgi:hypothetical protein
MRTLSRRLATLLAPVALLSLLALAACGVGQTSAKVPTAAEILHNATNVFDFSGTTHSTSSAAVQDLTFTMTMNMEIKLSSTSLGTSDIKETANATGKETLKPRRSQMDMTMALEGQNMTTSVIVDFATSTGYLKMSGLSALFGNSGDKWYKISYGALGSFGADTSMYMDYSKLKDATLVGSETINGVAVWHLRAKEDFNQSLPGATGATGTTGATGASNSTSNLNATVDYYFRKDNYRPVKVVIAVSDTLSNLGTMKLNTEMDFTSFNTGVTIALPPASDVTSFPDVG